jgi:glucosamine--fructose-6-phosphate aminotransferase (isomerizing)
MSVMLDEIYEQPRAVAAAIEQEHENVSALVRELQSGDVRYIIIAARGTSDNAATYAKYMLEIVTGLPVALAAPSVYTLYNARLSLAGCLMLGISQSGQATDVLQTLSAAHAAGAITACITNVPESPITEVSDYAFLCHAGEERAVAATKTYTTSLILVALLAAAWANDVELLDSLQGIPRLIQSTLQLDETIASSCERYKYIHECAVLARGLNQCTALEAALKMTETSYLVAKPYSGADFLHGPIAMVSAGFPCILFAPRGAAYTSMLELAAKLRDRQAEMVIVAQDPEILSFAAKPILVPVDVPELLSPLIYIIAGQLWAYHLALIRGYDPDKPRGLSKVTLTR